MPPLCVRDHRDPARTHWRSDGEGTWRHGISLDNLYRWKRQYGGVDRPELHRLQTLEDVRGLPQVLVYDNGPEFVSQAMDHCADWHGVHLDFIRPGRSVEYCFLESFKGRLRDECLNAHHIASRAEARTASEAWREGYNTARPHSGLGLRPPPNMRHG